MCQVANRGRHAPGKCEELWTSLTPEGKGQKENKDKLVAATESALQEEGAGWMSLLQDAVTKASDADQLGSMSG